MLRNLRNSFFVLICVLCLTACGDSTATKTKEKVQPAAQTSATTLPKIPMEIMKNLWDNCTGIDYIFHHLPFSMSQTDQGAIRSNLSYFENKEVPSIPANCKPIGRAFFQINGDVAHDVDLYYTEGCKYFILMENEKPKYANLMSETGDKFFNNMILQAMKTAKNNFGG